VGRLFAFEFFQGSAIALFFTAAIAIFLEHRPTSDLPQVFTLAALLLWSFGFLYSKLEHRLSTRVLITTVLIFNICVIVLFRLLMPYQVEQWFLFLFLASFNVIYLLNNLEFWGLAALLFDVRQSKRLFGIISAGDIPAKMLGYIGAIFLVPLIGTENLLWVAAGALLVSLFILGPLMELTELDASKEKANHHSSYSIRNIKMALTGNQLIRKIALVSFFSFCCFIVVNFIFYGYIKNEFKNDKDLASFFAIFFAVIRGITLILKLAGTNRMVDKIGLRTSLVITPAVLLCICFFAIFVSFQNYTKAAFYLFGMMSVTLEVLRSAIQSPVLLASMQPLPTHQRLRGHTFIKGLMDPFAFLFMGLLLWAISPIQGNLNFTIIGAVLFALIVCWIVFALSVDKNYIQTLEAAIHDRTISGRDVSITDQESLDFLLKKLKEGSESEAVSVLQLIASQPDERREFIEQALMHPSKIVRLLALRTIRSKKIVSMLPVLKQLLQHEEPSILAPVIRTITFLDDSENLSFFLDHPDPEVVQAATLVSLMQKDNPEKDKAESNLNKLFDSTDSKNKINALQIVGELRSSFYSDKVIELMSDLDPDVKQSARIAAAKIGTEDLVHKLMLEFSAATKDTDVLNALAIAGHSPLAGVKEYLTNHKCDGPKCRKLIALLGKIGGEASVVLLDECLRKFPENADTILLSLHQANIRTREGELQYQKNIRENLLSATHILFKINFAQAHPADHKLVARALQLELEGIRNRCLWLFSFLYDTEKVQKAKSGFELNIKESIANAIELIQLSVPKEFAIPFCMIFENGTVSDKCAQLQRTVHDSIVSEASLVKNILFDVDYTFNSWTKACVLYSLRNKAEILDVEFIEPFRRSENKVLKDTADFIISKRMAG
jgi:ATP/ADP translocase